MAIVGELIRGIYGRKAIDRKNRRKLKNYDFSIVSCNCNGSFIYHDLGLKFSSPFINLYILPDDYIKLIKNLKEYMSEDLVENNEHNIGFPVGQIRDIKIYFQHYPSFAEAKKKWEERKKRINYERIVFLFCDRDGCTMEHIREFDALPYENKVCFVHTPIPDIKSSFYIRGFEKENEVGILSDFTNQLLQIRYLDQFDYVSMLNNVH